MRFGLPEEIEARSKLLMVLQRTGAVGIGAPPLHWSLTRRSIKRAEDGGSRQARLERRIDATSGVPVSEILELRDAQKVLATRRRAPMPGGGRRDL